MLKAHVLLYGLFYICVLELTDTTIVNPHMAFIWVVFGNPKPIMI